MDRLQVLMAQLVPVPRDVAANVAAVERVLDRHPQAQLAVLPELFLTGYALSGIAELAVTVEDEPVARIRAAARRNRTAVVVGLAERLPSGATANSALCLDEAGDVQGLYRKVHLFGAEAEHFARGDRYPVLPILGLRVAPLICYDLEFPEPARAVAAAGAQLLVTVAANMAPFGPEHALFARARAVENRCPHVYLNRVGTESGLDFVGGSCTVDAAGHVVAQLGRTEAVELVSVPLHRGAGPDYLLDRCPDVPAIPVRQPAGPPLG